MAATRIWTNPTATFTPQGGSAITLKRITQAAFDSGGQLLTFSGDGDRYNTLNVNIMNNPSVTLTGADVVAFLDQMSGVTGTLVLSVQDAKNQAGTGALTLTCINACANNPSGTFPHAGVSSGSLTFSMSSADGTTNPMSYALAA